jgi:hypothetical protein
VEYNFIFILNQKKNTQKRRHSGHWNTKKILKANSMEPGSGFEIWVSIMPNPFLMNEYVSVFLLKSHPLSIR